MKKHEKWISCQDEGYPPSNFFGVGLGYIAERLDDEPLCPVNKCPMVIQLNFATTLRFKEEKGLYWQEGKLYSLENAEILEVDLRCCSHEPMFKVEAIERHVENIKLNNKFNKNNDYSLTAEEPLTFRQIFEDTGWNYCLRDIKYWIPLPPEMPNLRLKRFSYRCKEL